MLKDTAKWLKMFVNGPKHIGAIAPSSSYLGKAMAEQATGPIVIEIGAGTGALTRALTQKFSKDNLYIVEFEEKLSSILKNRFPEYHVLHANVLDLPKLLPASIIGKVDTIVSGIPLLNLSPIERKAIIDTCFALLKKDGSIVQFTYGFKSPIPTHKWNLYGKRIKYVLRNIPPAFMWKFSRLPIEIKS